jgi:hypothetical protein
LPSTSADIATVTAECSANLAGFVPYPIPTPQTMPTQETGTAPKPSGAC